MKHTADVAAPRETLQKTLLSAEHWILKKITSGPTAGKRACKQQQAVLFLLGVEHPLAARASDEALVTTAPEGAELQNRAVADFSLLLGERLFGPN